MGYKRVNMLKTSLLICLPLLGFSQREFKAEFDDCGSVLDIAPAVEGSVTITAPFKRSIKRHILFKGANVKICINGTIPSGAQQPEGLKNSAHGQIVVLGIPVP